MIYMGNDKIDTGGEVGISLFHRQTSVVQSRKTLFRETVIWIRHQYQDPEFLHRSGKFALKHVQNLLILPA
ncbi:hypothetical protein EHF33_20095 (plasmid) [Deinococcus psychrotolerans]|uniref:Uncharacterized protein n=1 Tax=Deinococcus psychrotolerans TaxID=2489213 RepID=A0A3G8YJS9_9DEIO|nr:hypothetical protein [Deinococcus psychrotolerans]AZI45213.1 hypothetical protein EHF33_20095 [Deinococcus psychrotolerans]